MRTGNGRIPTSRICRYGPGRVRNGKNLKNAVALLSEQGRAWTEKVGWRPFVVIKLVLYAG